MSSAPTQTLFRDYTLLASAFSRKNPHQSTSVPASPTAAPDVADQHRYARSGGPGRATRTRLAVGDSYRRTVVDETSDQSHLHRHVPDTRRIHGQRDSLFPGGVGKTPSPENFNSLLDDVRTRLFEVLPDEEWRQRGW